MKIDYNTLKSIAMEYGDTFYLLDSKQFTTNFNELQAAFRAIYPQSYIAYSYKTNYTPKLCRIVDDLGGFAETVSEMEIEIAYRVGVKPERIIFNGPYKNPDAVKKLLLDGGCVNIDSWEEYEYIHSIALENPDVVCNVGVRHNFEINDGVLSRFGIDVLSQEYQNIIDGIQSTPNIHLKEMHCHFAERRLDTWPLRAEGAVLLSKKLCEVPDNVDVGGGMYGKMGDSLKAQFKSYIPNYVEYAAAVATIFADEFSSYDVKPNLVIEPGSALVGDCMKFVALVTGIKKVRGKYIATLLGSVYNINPTLNGKNPPVTIYSDKSEGRGYYEDIDFGGYTCIESDYLYKHYQGLLSIGDYVVFDNVGSYSIVLKPPFILPNFAILDCSNDDGKIEVIKKRENFDDIFNKLSF